MVLSLLAVAVLATASAGVAYRLGYRHGGDAERACWTLEPAPAEAWLHGEITARRDTRKHPFLKSALVVRRDRSVNSIPVTVSSAPTAPPLAAGTTNNANGQHQLQ